MDFAAPPLSALSGTVFPGSLLSIPPESSIVGYAGDPLNPTPGTFSYGTGLIGTSGAYQLLLPTGGTYHLGVSLLLLPAAVPQSGGYLSLLQLATVSVTGDGGQDVMLPGIPETVAISGQVTDSNGIGVGGVSVEAITQEIATVPNGIFSRLTTTNLDGTYQFPIIFEYESAEV